MWDKIYRKSRYRKNSSKEQNLFRLLSHKELFNNILYDKKDISSAISLVEDGYTPYFIRGFFDGDGCINCCLGKYYRLYFYSSFEHNWEALFGILADLDINFTHTLIERKGGKHRSSQICLSNNIDIIKFFNYLYPDRIFDFGLLRKFEKLNSARETSGKVRRTSSKINVLRVFS